MNSSKWAHTPILYNVMKIILPREEQRPYVCYYWMLGSDEPFSVLTFPIGCPQIIFHRKSPLYIPEVVAKPLCAILQFVHQSYVNVPFGLLRIITIV